MSPDRCFTFFFVLGFSSLGPRISDLASFYNQFRSAPPTTFELGLEYGF